MKSIWGEMLTSSPHVSPKKFSAWVYWKVFRRFWPIFWLFISHGIGYSYFSGNFLLSFLLWYDSKILVKSRGGGTFLSLALSVNVWQKFFFFSWKLNISSFIFLIWTEQFWIWFRWKLTKTIKFPSFFKVFILPPVWLSNLGSDLSINNIVRLGSADTKSGSQNAAKMLELTEKWKYPDFRANK